MTQTNRNALPVGGSVFVGGVVLGIVVGALSGVLFTPRSGENTHEYLRKQVNELDEAIKNNNPYLLKAGKRQVSTALRSER